MMADQSKLSFSQRAEAERLLEEMVEGDLSIYAHELVKLRAEFSPKIVEKPMMRQVELAVGFPQNTWINHFVDTDMSDEDLQDELKLLALLPGTLKEEEIAFVHLMCIEQDVEEEENDES